MSVEMSPSWMSQEGCHLVVSLETSLSRSLMSKTVQMVSMARAVNENRH